MPTSDGFHPDFDSKTTEVTRNKVHHVRASDITSDTAQSEGMRRFAALSGQSVGTEKLWMGETHVSPGAASANHHHGEAETAIYVRSGNPDFVFHVQGVQGVQEVRISAGPGDYIFVPPYLPHREENPDPNTPAEVVIARSTQEAIVVNLPALYPL